jgi:hypothetical protein
MAQFHFDRTHSLYLTIMWVVVDEDDDGEAD